MQLALDPYMFRRVADLGYRHIELSSHPPHKHDMDDPRRWLVSVDPAHRWQQL